jgi:hypothetical protein
MMTANKLQVFEILHKFENEKSKKEKINVLQTYNIMPLLDFLRGTFDDAIQWQLPPGTPPYTPNNPESPPSSLYKQHLKFKYFVKGLHECENLNKIRREKMFINILEAIHPRDAEHIVEMVNKKCSVTGLTKNLVKEAFPKLLVK